MKGATQGLKVTQASLILIGFVCATVIALAWTKTTFLASFVPTQNHVLQLDLGPKETLEQNSTSVPSGLTQVDSLSYSGTELGSESGDAVKYTRKGETSAAGKNVSDELSSRQKKSKKDGSVKQNSSNVESSLEMVQSRTLPTSAGNKDCNYGKGKWVHDDNWPIYSGHGCKQWLSPMWACRLTQRTDFEYEKLRWEPKNCKVEKFTGAKFLNRMRSKTLAFVGDSLGRQQFQSLMCMVSGGEERADIVDVGPEYGLVKDVHSVRPDGWAYRFRETNTTILYYWSASLCDLEPIDPSKPDTDIAMHLDRPPAFLRHYLDKLDVLVLNTGHHWNRGKLKANRWVMYVGGHPNTDRKIATVGGAKALTVHSIVKWVDSQLPSHPHLKPFLRSLAPRHFFNGEWNTGGTCDNTTPLSGGKEVVEEQSSDSLAADAVNGTSVKLLDITTLSQLRDEGHISRYSIKATPGVQDCLHWCLPGIPDTWNEILFNQL